MIKKAIVILSIMFFGLHLQGQNLLPQPKTIVPKTGAFQIKNTVSVFNFHNKDILKSLKEALLLNGLKTTINKKPNIDLKQVESQEKLSDILKSKNLSSPFKLGPEGYILNVSPKNIEILALTDAGVFYGVQTLNQLFNLYSSKKSIPCMTIYDKPDIAVRAWQDDISRGPIPSLETLKKEIKTMASFKLNYFTLYTEHVLKLQKHPTIAPKDGITREELEELAVYAKKHFIKLIGNYQSFGHMSKTLSKPAYQHLAENDHIISPTLAESYEFLNDVYEEIVPQYDGKYFNINCDETFGLGEGKSKAMADSIGVSGIYVYHINKLDSLLKKYNKQILMWGDIATSYPEIVSSLPKDITVMAWAYQEADNFDFAITPISDQDLDFWVAPGISCWSNVYPDLRQAEVNIYNFIRDGHKLNASGVLNTSWDDDGLNFFNNNWHGFTWGAENSWNAPPNLELEASKAHRITRYANFNKAFDIHFFGLNETNKSLTEIMIQFSALHQNNIREALKNNRFFEPIFPIHLDYIQKGEKEKNLKVLNQLSDISLRLKALPTSKNQETIQYLQFAIEQARFILEKNEFRIAINEYLNSNTRFTKEELKLRNKGLIKRLTQLKNEYINLWNKENRPEWLKVNEKKFDVLLKSLNELGAQTLIEPKNEINALGRKVEIRSVFNDFPLYYSINEDSVSSSSLLYTKPFYVKKDVTIKAKTINGNEAYANQEVSLLYHMALGKLYKQNTNYSTYHPSYDGGGKYALVDGIVGEAKDYRSGKWQAYGGQDIDVELAFPDRESLNTFSMGFFQNTEAWVIFPKQVEIYIKNSLEEEYTLFKTIKGTVEPEEKGNLKNNYEATLDGIKPAYIKVVAKYYGKLPEWHHAGSKYNSMLFADEIIIK